MEVNSHVQILTEPVTSAACPKCGAMLEIPDIPAFTMVQCPTCEFEFAAPAKFGSFLLLQVLGMGGMGGVYRARDEALNREVAIKVMLKSLGDDPQFVETFQREAQAAAKLNHPNIAQVYSFGQVMGQPYIAMELIPGGSLDKMMASQGALDPAVVFHVGVQIAEGLSEAAEANLVHGDVKPENILFDAEKNAKLVDFGLAAMQTGPNHEVWGTPYYIAPEKVRKQKTDCRSDIYSLGATLYHAIAGVPPFDGADAAAVVKARFDGTPKSLRSLRGNVVPEEVENIIMRMLAVNPVMRYPTYESLLGDMRRFLSTAGPVNVASSGKKIMIRGKRPKLTASPVGEGGGTPLPEGMTPIDQIEAEEESERAARRRGRKIIGLVFLGLVLLIGALTGGFFAIRHSMEQKKVAKETARSEGQQKEANASIAKALGEAKKLAERVNANIPEAKKYADEAVEAVVAVLGEDSRGWLIPPEPSYATKLPAAEASSNAVPAQADGGKITLDAAEVERLAKLLPPNLAKDLKELDKLPAGQAFAKMEEIAKALPKKEGEEVKAQLDAVKALKEGLGEAMQQMAEGMAAAMGEAMQQMAEGMATAMGEAMQQMTGAAGDTEAIPDYPVIKMVRGMFADMYGIKKAAALADTLAAEIEGIKKNAETLKGAEQEKTLVAQANAAVGKWNAMNGLKELAVTSTTVAQMKKTLESVKGEVKSMAANREREARDREKAEKAEAEQEKQRQEHEALKAKTADEIASVHNKEKEIVPMLKQLQIREATRLLMALSPSLETKGGLDAHAMAEERIKRIEEFHKYLVEKTPGFKSSKGWSIETADAKTMTVNGKKIPWAEIFETRMEIVAELVNGLVMSPQATKNMRIRERTRLETNAALCLFLFYGDVPTAVDRAKQIATQAAENFSADADIIKGVLPEFFE